MESNQQPAALTEGGGNRAGSWTGVCGLRVTSGNKRGAGFAKSDPGEISGRLGTGRERKGPAGVKNWLAKKKRKSGEKKKIRSGNIFESRG